MASIAPFQCLGGPRYAGLSLPASGKIGGYSKVSFEVLFEPVAPGEVELVLDVRFLVKEQGYRDVKVCWQRTSTANAQVAAVLCSSLLDTKSWGGCCCQPCLLLRSALHGCGVLTQPARHCMRPRFLRSAFQSLLLARTYQ